MLIGQSFIAPASPGKVDYYTPWFPRGGNVGTIVAEVLRLSSTSISIGITMEQKDQDESDAAATSAGSFTTISATGTYSASLSSSGVKQLVRCKINLGSANATVQWAHMRVNPPIWQPN